jgi:hypothetical protein
VPGNCRHPFDQAQGEKIMRWKIGLFGGALSALVIAGSLGISSPAQAACASTDPVNATTAEQAAQAMQQAGYSQIQVYEKGCDSAWHAHAMLNGSAVNVVWNRDGQVLTEGN